MTPLNDDHTYQAAAAQVVRLLSRLADTPRSDGEWMDAAIRADLIDRVQHSVSRVRAGDCRDAGVRSTDLSRAVVDGNGPRDPDHPLFAAFDQLDQARAVVAGGKGTQGGSAGSGDGDQAERARQSVQRILDGWARDSGVWCVAGSAMDEGDRWIVGFQSRAFLVDGNIGASLTGNAPFVVPKDGSAPYQLPT